MHNNWKKFLITSHFHYRTQTLDPRNGYAYRTRFMQIQCFYQEVRCHRTGVGNLRPAGWMRPAKAFYPDRDLFSFFNDRRAETNCRNDSHTFFGLCHQSGRKKA